MIQCTESHKLCKWLDFFCLYHGDSYVSVTVGNSGWNPMHTHFITRYHVEGDGHSLTNRSPSSSGDQCHLVGGEGNWLVVTNVISSLICFFYCVTLTCNKNNDFRSYNTVPTSYMVNIKQS